jgi:TPR repeat protein
MTIMESASSRVCRRGARQTRSLRFASATRKTGPHLQKAELIKILGVSARNVLSPKRRLHRASEKSFAAGNYAAGFAKLLKLAKHGDPADCYRLAACYEQGRGTKRNFGQAIAWYEAAAKQGLVEAMVRLGDIYLSAQREAGAASPVDARTNSSRALTVEQPDPKLQIRNATYWNDKAAAAGSAEGQANLAFQYASGLGVSRDLKTARELFEKSAAQGYARGQLGLGLLLAADSSSNDGKQRAIHLLRDAAHQGNADAKFALARLLVHETPARESGDEAADLLLELATGNNTEAMYQLGEMYRLGDKVRQDFRLAETWLKRACTRGHLRAHTSLSELLSTQLSPPHSEEAAIVLRQGAEMGDPRCQIRLAEMYLTGRGTLVDTTAAAYWFRRAGEQGYVSARACWEKALHGYGVGRQWFEKPRLRYFDYSIERFLSPPREG